MSADGGDAALRAGDAEALAAARAGAREGAAGEPGRPIVAVLDYGMGNLRSVARALERAGGRPVVTGDPDAALGADALVLPGVGAFGRCVRNIREGGLEGPIRAFIDSGRPVLGVCLGMQVLFEWSEEGDEDGLGLLEGRVRRLPSSVKVPHMGWNRVGWVGDVPLAQALHPDAWYYFVHSYAVDADLPFTVGVADYGGPFAAAVARDNVFATQFHPEKSGPSGLAIYAAFVAGVRDRIRVAAGGKAP